MNPISKTSLRVAVTGAVLAMMPMLTHAAPEPGGGHGKAAGMPQLDFGTYPGQIFWLAVSFAVLFILMWKVAIPRVGDVIDMRERKIRADLERAEHLRDEITAVEESIERALSAARAEAQDILRKAQEKIAADHARKRERLDSDLAAKIAGAEARIDAARKQALSCVKDIANGVAAAVVEKLTGAAPPERGAISAAVDAAWKEA